MATLWARKPVQTLKAQAEEPDVQALTTHGSLPLKRALSAINLVALGIGAIIGAGIFVLTGHAAAAIAGPAISLSFVLGAIACAFAGLCYAEMASDCQPGADAENEINKKAGMPAFEPTAEEREIVYQCSGFGMPQTDICHLISVHPH